MYWMYKHASLVEIIVMHGGQDYQLLYSENTKHNKHFIDLFFSVKYADPYFLNSTLVTPGIFKLYINYIIKW